MTDIALRVEGLSKRYRVGYQANTTGGYYRYKSLRDSLGGIARRPLQTLRTAVVHDPMNDDNSFWALKDINFEVKRGEVVGIVGRNGAGKSTLLKILSRITKPTTGRVDLFGRVGSLLEVGTGFHPELTGRENIFLNGAILGMTKAEVKAKFDEIVAFSEVEKFLDMAVKQYSSGMYMRLAFAVAANLEPEILVVDEVLAVGDAEFQKKCLGKMKDIANGGRTVLFVSHNTSAMERLCMAGLLLDKGLLTHTGAIDDILLRYRTSFTPAAREEELASRTDRSGSGAVKLTSWRLEDERGLKIDRIKPGQQFSIVLAYKSERDLRFSTVDPGISIGRGEHELLTVHYASYNGGKLCGLPAEGELRCTIDGLALAASDYRIGARVLVDDVEADWPRGGIGDLIIEEGEFYHSGSSGFGAAAPLLIRGHWELGRTAQR